MRSIEGYVHVSEFIRGHLIIMGPNVNLKNSGSENFETNGLIPYKELPECKRGMSEFHKKAKPAKAYAAKISMRVAENYDELENFRNMSGLVVIMRNHEDNYKVDELLGPVVDNCNSLAPIPGARLGDTKFTVYTKRNSKGKSGTPFERALYLLGEVNRQGDCPGTIATFKLRKI